VEAAGDQVAEDAAGRGVLIEVEGLWVPLRCELHDLGHVDGVRHVPLPVRSAAAHRRADGIR
jgi:hypothetical protein